MVVLVVLDVSDSVFGSILILELIMICRYQYLPRVFLTSMEGLRKIHVATKVLLQAKILSYNGLYNPRDLPIRHNPIEEIMSKTLQTWKESGKSYSHSLFNF